MANETGATGAWQRADADDAADPEHVDDLAERKAQAGRTAAKARGAHAAAEQALSEAREARDAHLREAELLRTGYEKAGKRAESPGPAPVTGAENMFRSTCARPT